MFISKKKSIQSSCLITSSLSLKKGNQQSCQTLQSKACFFKIFVTDSNPKFFCYPAESKDPASFYGRQGGHPSGERLRPADFSAIKAFGFQRSCQVLRRKTVRGSLQGSKSNLSQVFLKAKPINKQNHLYNKNYQIIRPLLHLSRTEISLICKKLLIPVYPDKSNQCIKYSRNRIRKQLLPSLKLFYNPQIEQALFQFSEFLCKEQNFIRILFNAIPHTFLKTVKEKKYK